MQATCKSAKWEEMWCSCSTEDVRSSVMAWRWNNPFKRTAAPRYLPTPYRHQRCKYHHHHNLSHLNINMIDPISITGLVLAIVSVIQGAGRIWSRLWTRLKAVFGGLRSQSACKRALPPGRTQQVPINWLTAIAPRRLDDRGPIPAAKRVDFHSGGKRKPQERGIEAIFGPCQSLWLERLWFMSGASPRLGSGSICKGMWRIWTCGVVGWGW